MGGYSLQTVLGKVTVVRMWVPDNVLQWVQVKFQAVSWWQETGSGDPHGLQLWCDGEASSAACLKEPRYDGRALWCRAWNITGARFIIPQKYHVKALSAPRRADTASGGMTWSSVHDALRSLTLTQPKAVHCHPGHRWPAATSLLPWPYAIKSEYVMLLRRT